MTKKNNGTDWKVLLQTFEEVANTPLPEVEDFWLNREGLAKEIAKEVPLDSPEDIEIKERFKGWDYLRSFGWNDIQGKTLRVVHGLSTLDIEWAVIDPQGKAYRSIPASYLYSGGNLLSLDLGSLEIKGTWYVAVRRTQPPKVEKKELKTLTCHTNHKEGVASASLSFPDLLEGKIKVVHNLNTGDLDLSIVELRLNKRVKTLTPVRGYSNLNEFIIDLSCLGQFEGTVALVVKSVEKKEEKKASMRDKSNQTISGIALSHQQITDTNYTGSSFVGVNLNHITFKGCDFTGVRFSKTNLNHVKFYECVFSGTTFSDCNLSHTSFYGGTVEKVKMTDCNITHSSIPPSGVQFYGATNISHCNTSFL